MDSFHTEHTDAAQFNNILDHYDNASESLTEKILKVEEDIKDIKANIEEEKKGISGTQHDEKLRLQIRFGLFANTADEVQVALIYGIYLHGAFLNYGTLTFFL
jgi:hypothetical protein